MTDRKQVTIGLYPDRHPKLFSRFVGPDGDLNKEFNPSQEIPALAEKFLDGNNEKDEIAERLQNIEKMIKNLRSVGVINDPQAEEMRERAKKMRKKVPVSR